MSSSSCIFWKKFSLILCLNVFGLLAVFKSDIEKSKMFYQENDHMT